MMQCSRTVLFATPILYGIYLFSSITLVLVHTSTLSHQDDYRHS